MPGCASHSALTAPHARRSARGGRAAPVVRLERARCRDHARGRGPGHCRQVSCCRVRRGTPGARVATLVSLRNNVCAGARMAALHQSAQRWRVCVPQRPLPLRTRPCTTVCKVGCAGLRAACGEEAARACITRVCPHACSHLCARQPGANPLLPRAPGDKPKGASRARHRRSPGAQLMRGIPCHCRAHRWWSRRRASSSASTTRARAPPRSGKGGGGGARAASTPGARATLVIAHPCPLLFALHRRYIFLARLIDASGELGVQVFNDQASRGRGKARGRVPHATMYGCYGLPPPTHPRAGRCAAGARC